MVRLVDEFSTGHLEVLLFLESDRTAITTLEKLEAVFARYRTEYKGRLDRMAFRWILSDLVSRMVIHLGDVEDFNEYGSQQENLVMMESKVRPIQITELGYHLLDLLRTNAQ